MSKKIRCNGASLKALIKVMDMLFVSGSSAKRDLNMIYVVTENESHCDQLSQRFEDALDGLNLLNGYDKFTEGYEITVFKANGTTKKVKVRFISKHVFTRNYSAYCRGNKYVVVYDD